MIKYLKIIFYIIILNSLIQSCAEKANTSIELEVLNDVLPLLVSSDYGRLPVKHPLFNKSDSLDYMLKVKSYKERMDTISKILYIKDSLVLMEIEDYNYWHNKLEEEHIDFVDILKRYKKCQLTDITFINIADLTIGGIRLVPTLLNREVINQHIDSASTLVIGQILISRVIFDKNYQRGLFEFSFFCNTKTKCGYSLFVLVEKRNQAWVIREKYSNWIL